MADQSTSPVWTLKIELDGDVRRLKGWPSSGRAPSTQSIREAICEVFFLSPAQAESLCLKYRDDEGDLCILTEVTLQDALILAAEEPRVLRLTAAFAEPRSGPGPAQACAEPAEPAEPNPPAEAAAGPSASSPSARSGIAGRLATARPRLAEGVAHFTEGLAGDFRSTREDLQSALRPKAAGTEAGEQLPQQVGPVAAAAATVAGVVAAARLAPVRATRLAAHSVAALAGTPEAERTAPEAAGGAAASAAVAEPEVPSVAGDGAADAPGGVAGEFAHFKKQVVHDFDTAREEVKAAFGYVVGGADETSPASGPAAEGSQQQRTARSVVPAVASAVAGVAVASTLVPLRGFRLAVAAASVASSRGAASGAAARTEAPGQPAHSPVDPPASAPGPTADGGQRDPCAREDGAPATAAPAEAAAPAASSGEQPAQPADAAAFAASSDEQLAQPEQAAAPAASSDEQSA